MSNGIVSSITRAGTTEPFDIQVVRNQVDGHSNVNINGYNAAVAGTAIPLWENATAYTFPASAVTMTVASSSATDTSPAKVTISGLDTNWNPISEQVTLNGTTGVTTVNQYLRINSVLMNTPATSQTSNVGTITVKNGSTTYGQINPGLGRSQMTVYSVPNNFNFHLRRINAWSGTSLSSSVSIFYNLVTQTYGNASLTAAQISFILFVDVHRYCPNVFPPKTDIQFQFLTSDSSSQHVSLYAEGLLVPADVLTTQPGN